MPTTPVSEVSTEQPPRLEIAFSWLLGKGWRWALGVTFWCGLDRNGGKDGAHCWVAGDGRSCLSSFSYKTAKAEVRDIPFAGPLFWGHCGCPCRWWQGLHILVQPGVGGVLIPQLPFLCLLPAAEHCPQSPCHPPLQNGSDKPRTGSWLQPFPSVAAHSGHTAGPPASPQGRAALPHLSLW